MSDYPVIDAIWKKGKEFFDGNQGLTPVSCVIDMPRYQMLRKEIAKMENKHGPGGIAHIRDRGHRVWVSSMKVYPVLDANGYLHVTGVEI